MWKSLLKIAINHPLHPNISIHILYFFSFLWTEIYIYLLFVKKEVIISKADC